ncbi:MAG: hypothetical protein JNL67_05435 [Planctomycetaceae bacterium]|nr:hypothetical protein [Planctomycetaceae bacterium]
MSSYPNQGLSSMVHAADKTRWRLLLAPGWSRRLTGSLVVAISGIFLCESTSLGWDGGQSVTQSTLSNRDPALMTILQAERSTAGSEELQSAWQTVSQWPTERLSEVLDAADEANPVALNWLRTAIDGMTEQPGFELPVNMLEQVVQDTTRKFASRRIAWDLLESAEPKLMESIAESLIADPIATFRRPAIQTKIALANTFEKGSVERKQVLDRAFGAARDEDQVGEIARMLETEYGEKPDLATHFGYVVDWHVLGPFPNIAEAGFHDSLAPEKILLSDFDSQGKPNPELEYEGSAGSLKWQTHSAVSDTGEMDLNKVLGNEKEVVGYGVSIFNSSQERSAEIRLRMQNAFKLWLNGELIQSQPIGHTGNSFDQYVIPVSLKKGQNLILIKSCQNKPPQEMEWYDVWHLNVRICDASGTAIREGE